MIIVREINKRLMFLSGVTETPHDDKFGLVKTNNRTEARAEFATN